MFLLNELIWILLVKVSQCFSGVPWVMTAGANNSLFLRFQFVGIMAELDRIRQQKDKILFISRQHGIMNVRIFGSVARHEETPHSDIDLLVDLEPGRSLLDLGGALIKLQELLGRKIDIVTEHGLHWYLKDKIIKEAQLL